MMLYDDVKRLCLNRTKNDDFMWIIMLIISGCISDKIFFKINIYFNCKQLYFYILYTVNCKGNLRCIDKNIIKCMLTNI